MSPTTWILDLFSAIDRKDMDGFVQFLSEDAIFRYGSQPAAVGRAQIRDALKGFFSMIHSLSHSLHRIWANGEWITVQGEVTYTLSSGASITLPFVDLFLMTGPKVREYLIYIDPAPLFDAMKA
ncbi:MAG TPA: nuclear transport factor 2 family protein [Thermoanaerobaculia bacterium]|nr:nuclear transport factor 2 family protein [Thermoanaerobaculia bacterium]HUM28959.1 nuclear transport factor 2 family protein [Thermoanaerobaculia bacterium]HXK67109.1 nuclear transport factor 2 family protein [Thermoanaerobaculia bacterium]